MHEAQASDTVLARLEALAARLDGQTAEVASLKGEIARLTAENAQVTAWLARSSEGTVPPAALHHAEPPAEPPTTSRRGMLRRMMGTSAAAAALLLLAKQAPAAEAASRTTILNASVSTDNYGIASAVGALDPGTLIGNITGVGFGAIGTFGSPGYAPPGSAGMLGQGSGAFYGVIGLSAGNPGVFGQSNSSAGVYGKAQTNAGVFGDSPVVAVAGVSGAGLGVQGTSSSNAGVYGTSTSNAGVFGISPAIGVFGTSPNIAVWGNTSTGTGVFGQATNANGWAGQFAGRVFVNGAFTVVGGAKSAAVKRKDGSLGRVYCQESPEPWFEDFGTADLKGGQATIALSADFDEVVDGNDYRVFLTEIGDCGGLFVGRKGPHQFVVRSRAGAAASGTFDYRVVAKRLDPVGGRLEKVDLPNAPTPKSLPEAVEGPKLQPTPAFRR
jgi:hypothetical protein